MRDEFFSDGRALGEHQDWRRKAKWAGRLPAPAIVDPVDLGGVNLGEERGRGKYWNDETSFNLFWAWASAGKGGFTLQDRGVNPKT